VIANVVHGDAVVATVTLSGQFESLPKRSNACDSLGLDDSTKVGIAFVHIGGGWGQR
jgi:hypothetical protein